MANKLDFQKFSKTITDAESIVIVAHENPDGDSVASQLALAQILSRMQKKVTIWSKEPVPKNYAFLPGQEHWNITKHSDDCACDLLIIIDSAEIKRLDEAVASKMSQFKTVVNLDHHLSNMGFGDMQIIDETASSCGEIILEFLAELNQDISLEIAECLYVSILTDTGGFRYRNTTSKVFRLAADLLEKGIDVEKIYSHVYGNIPIAKTLLFSKSLDTLEFCFNNKVAVMVLENKIFSETGASREYIEGIIDYVRMIEGVEIAVLFIEQETTDRVKLSMRSNCKNIDVNVFAKEYGGGGHSTASGAKIPGDIHAICKDVLTNIGLRIYPGIPKR